MSGTERRRAGAGVWYSSERWFRDAPSPHSPNISTASHMLLAPCRTRSSGRETGCGVVMRGDGGDARSLFPQPPAARRHSPRLVQWKNSSPNITGATPRGGDNARNIRWSILRGGFGTRRMPGLKPTLPVFMAFALPLPFRRDRPPPLSPKVRPSSCDAGVRSLQLGCVPTNSRKTNCRIPPWR